MRLNGEEGDSRHRGQGDGAVTLAEPAGHDLLPLVGMTLVSSFRIRVHGLMEVNGNE